MIMDHGFDTISTWLLCRPVFEMLSQSPNAMTFGPLVIMCAFFTQTLEQYYTNKFSLEILNAPGIGLCFIWGTALVCGVCGPEFWTEHTIYGQSISMIIPYIVSILVPLTVLGNLFNAVRSVLAQGRDVLIESRLFLWPMFLAYSNYTLY